MHRTFSSLIVLACLALPLQAQLPLGLGLKGGARLTDFTSSASDVTTQDHVYIIGPYAELRLPLGFSVELDLLYMRSGSTLQTAVVSGQLGNSPGATSFQQFNMISLSFQQFNMNSFNLPILAKKTFGAHGLIFRPFVEAGIANRYSTGVPGSNSGAIVLVPPSLGPVYKTTSGWQEGLVLGGGVQFKLLMLKISGELRWSCYGNISTSTLPKLSANQAELLFGIGI